MKGHATSGAARRICVTVCERLSVQRAEQAADGTDSGLPVGSARSSEEICSNFVVKAAPLGFQFRATTALARPPTPLQRWRPPKSQWRKPPGRGFWTSAPFKEL